MPLTAEQVGERVAAGINRTEGLLQAMEEAWRTCISHPAPEFVILTPRFARVYRRFMRPPRRQIAGASVRAVKRRAVRRPW